MHDLNDYFYFVTVVEKQGFSKAARALDIPKSRLSRHVQNLEDRLGVRLIQRTSRQFHVTETGQLFYKHARSMIDEMEKAEASIHSTKATLSGRVTLSCSVGVAQFAIKQLVLNFLAQHPQIEIAQQVSNHPVDLIAQGIDLAIRGHNSPLPDSSLIQRRLATVQWHLFASATYLETHGIPQTPNDLTNHRGLKMGWQPSAGQWTLENNGGIKKRVPFSPQLCSDDMSTLKAAAVMGLGIVSLPAYTCRDEINHGTLKRVLPEWITANAELTIVMPSRMGVTPQARALADFLLQEVQNAVSVNPI